MRIYTVLLVLSFASSFSLAASTFTSLVVFGDSLSDTGNLYNETFGIGPGPLQNYATGILTDGPTTSPSTQISGLWDQQLAQTLGLATPVASTSGGLNYAYAGAQTGSGFATLVLQGIPLPVPNLNTQIASFLAASNSVAPASYLYAIWGGSNDLLDNAGAYATSPTAVNLNTLDNTPATLIANEVSNIQALYAAGARNFLFFDVPDLGAAPAVAGSPAEVATLKQLSALTEADFYAGIAQLRSTEPGIDIIPVDVFAASLALEANYTAYGFMNITTPAQGLTGVNPDQYFYWDTEHPTTKGDQFIANVASQAILASAPEPSTYALAASALVFAFAAALNRRREAAQA